MSQKSSKGYPNVSDSGPTSGKSAKILRRTFTGMAPIVCPALSPDMSWEIVVDEAIRSLSAFPLPIRTALAVGSVAFEQGARFWPLSKGRSASGLLKETREKYFHSWWTSKLRVKREYARGLKSILCYGYYEQPQVLEAIGYRPAAWIKKVKSEREEKFHLAIVKAKTDIVTPDPLPPYPFVSDVQAGAGADAGAGAGAGAGANRE